MSSPGPPPAGVVNLLCEGEREVRRCGEEITDRVRPSQFRPHPVRASRAAPPDRRRLQDTPLRIRDLAFLPDGHPALLLASSGGHRVGLLRRSDEWRAAK